MRNPFLLGVAACLLGVQAHAATVAYYEFNGTGTAAVGATVPDTTGRHDGVVTGGALTYGADAFAGGYLSFAADAGTGNPGNRVVIPGAADLLFTIDQEYTFEVIFRTIQTATNGVLLSKGCDVSNPDSQWWLRHNGAGRAQGLVEGVDNTTEDSATSGASTALVNDGKWHHVALVFKGASTPKRLDVYVDGVLGASDTSIGTLGVIGGVDSDPVVLGEFASLAANRSFAGDLAAVRFSDVALAPSQFLPVGVTYLSDVAPTNNASFLPPSTVAGFVVNSPTVGVPQANIRVWLNGSDVSSQLTFSGTDAQRSVSLAALAANTVYQMDISVTDLAANVITRSVKFNTFSSNLLFVEGEDYNFESGQFIDHPVLSSVAGPNNYLDRLGVEGVDYHQTNTPVALYRIGDQVGTPVSTDVARQAYLDAQVTDPGVADYMTANHANSEWLNYTRTFPANTYRVYARLAKGGTVPVVIQVDEVTSGSTTSSQTLAPIGFFRRTPTTAANDFDFVALTDALGKEVALSLGGQRTLRLTLVSGTAGMNLNYLLFAPPGGVRRPFVASVSPAAGADSDLNNPPLLVSIRNADTQVSTGTIQLKLDGATVVPVATGNSLGLDLSYTPSLLSTGWHTVRLVFSDTAAVSLTNEWQFRVANPATRGYWKFNEQSAGSTTTTNAGAILDSSGNVRHGTASVAGQAFVAGSFNYGSTPALRFTTGADRVVVPDSAGSFNFTSGFTFEALIRTTNSGTAAAILAKNGTGDGEGEYWWRAPGAAGGKQRFGVNGNFLAGTNTINDGNWHHLAVVCDPAAGELRLYVDYSLDASTNNLIFDRPIGRPADLQIGGFIGTTTSEFDGDMDFVRITPAALTTAQFVTPGVALEPLVRRVVPGRGARNVSPRSQIGAEFQNRDTLVVLSSLKLFVDGVDVTASSTKTGDASSALITYTPATALATGTHTARTTFNDNATPARAYTNDWSFTVVGAVPMLALYQLNEQAPGNYADATPGAILDASGNGRHLTADGSPLPFYTTGAPNYGDSPALSFTAGDDRLYTSDTAAFNFGLNDSFTLEAVVRTTYGATFTGNIVGRDWGSALPSWWFRLDAGYPRFLVAQNGGPEPSITATTAVNDGEWHHVAAVRDTTDRKLRVYVDYVLAGETADTLTAAPTNAQNLVIGAYNNGSRQFEGDMDLVRITAAALDPSWFVQLGGMASPVMLANLTLAGNQISFSFMTESGRTYVVEAAGALGAGWTELQTITGDGTSKPVSYPATGEKRFFRVRVQ